MIRVRDLTKQVLATDQPLATASGVIGAMAGVISALRGEPAAVQVLRAFADELERETPEPTQQ